MTEAAVGLSFRLFRWLFPVRPLGPTEMPLSDQERRVYRRWEFRGLLPAFLVVPALGYLWFPALSWAAGCFSQNSPDTLFLLRPDPVIWFVPALLLGVITAAIPLNGLYLALLRSRYRRFSRFCDERVGFDGGRAFAVLVAVFVVGTLVFFTVAVRSFARFTGSGVEIGRTLLPGRTFYAYERVRSVEHRATFRAPMGTTIRAPHYVIAFDDGSAWYSNGVHNPPQEVVERIARLIAQRTVGRSPSDPEPFANRRDRAGIVRGGSTPLSASCQI
jgi:hypothetical protein